MLYALQSCFELAFVPAFQVRTLPALGTSSPSKKRPLPKSLDTMEEEYGGQIYSGGGGHHLASPQQPGQSLAGYPRSGLARNSTASALPPLMKGSRLSVLSTTVSAPGMSGGVAPSCGPEGGMGEDGEGRWRDRQEAWVERGQHRGSEPEEDGEQAFPFLAEDEMTLPDDRFEVCMI